MRPRWRLILLVTQADEHEVTTDRVIDLGLLTSESGLTTCLIEYQPPELASKRGID